MFGQTFLVGDQRRKPSSDSYPFLRCHPRHQMSSSGLRVNKLPPYRSSISVPSPTTWKRRTVCCCFRLSLSGYRTKLRTCSFSFALLGIQVWPVIVALTLLRLLSRKYSSGLPYLRMCRAFASPAFTVSQPSVAVMFRVRMVLQCTGRSQMTYCNSTILRLRPERPVRSTFYFCTMIFLIRVAGPIRDRQFRKYG